MLGLKFISPRPAKFQTFDNSVHRCHHDSQTNVSIPTRKCCFTTNAELLASLNAHMCFHPSSNISEFFKTFSGNVLCTVGVFSLLPTLQRSNLLRTANDSFAEEIVNRRLNAVVVSSGWWRDGNLRQFQRL
jgi:hypothetical protein